ncbi:hypothetical protein DES36_11249 [Alkalibaculum bacchi]|uniref:Uncharacterized protein n=1 Tax=Alkalibaculum bacchi TaxID=645887 RepID=A0A366I5E0_9FIRM|nr:hypothetical protein [Alkalibaculum bacchi]RBP62076.1 hypothetical protein DES36_11249 [Alkalibaculum bacchi]
MYKIGLLLVMILATLLMIVTWTLFKRKKQKLVGLLLVPYCFYFLALLSFGTEIQVLEDYLNKQIYTFSLGFFYIHIMLTMMIITNMMKE